MILRPYIDREGRNSFELWFLSLEAGNRARVAVYLDRMERDNLFERKERGRRRDGTSDEFRTGLSRLFWTGRRDSCHSSRRWQQEESAERYCQRATTVDRVQGRKKGADMPLGKEFKETVKAQLEKSTGFRRALLREAVNCLVAGDVETGKSVLRTYINGTVGFIRLGEALGRSPKTLMRMLGPKGNPQIRNFFEIVAYLQKVEGTVLEVVDRKAA